MASCELTKNIHLIIIICDLVQFLIFKLKINYRSVDKKIKKGEIIISVHFQFLVNFLVF